MIVITKVEFLCTSDDRTFDHMMYSPTSGIVEHEYVRGNTYLRPTDGMPITIAATDEAQEILGIMYTHVKELQKTIKEQKTRIEELNKMLPKHLNAFNLI